MYLICVPLFATTSGRKLLLVDVVVRVGSEFRNSRPQYHVYDPCTTNPSFPEPSLPSMMTRSPGYPGERVIIDGNDGSGNDGFVVHGSYTWYWGLEFRNSDPTRTTTSTSSNFRPDVVANNGTHIKYINLVIHDGGVAFYTYTAMPDVEIYGSILYNNGWQGPDRGHGHGLYLKNDVGPVVARDNVVFNQFGYGIHIYSDVGDGRLN